MLASSPLQHSLEAKCENEILEITHRFLVWLTSFTEELAGGRNNGKERQPR